MAPTGVMETTAKYKAESAKTPVATTGAITLDQNVTTENTDPKTKTLSAAVSMASLLKGTLTYTWESTQDNVGDAGALVKYIIDSSTNTATDQGVFLLGAKS